MPDIFDTKKRSEIMSNISSKDSKPEILVRKWLFSKGYRYRKNDKRLPGTPDILLPKYKVVIFIHGCFWHGHKNCKRSKLPETRKKFWEEKIKKNIVRDKKNMRDLKKLGWNILIIWTCKLKKSTFQKTLSMIIFRIKKNKS